MLLGLLAATLPDDGGCDAYGGALSGPRDIGAHELDAVENADCAPR